MKANLSDGVFIGKEELDRILLLNESGKDALKSLLGHTGYFDQYYSCGILGNGLVSIVSMPTLGGYGIVHKSFGSSNDLVTNSLGRMVVGMDGSGNEIGVVSPEDFTGKECFIPSSSFPTEEGATYILALASAKTNYENALININSSGVGTITKGWAFVKNVLRSSITGRHSKIKTSGNQVLTILSVDQINHTIQFDGDSFVVENGARFMVLQTLSPLSENDALPLYSYDTCEIHFRKLTSDVNSGVNSLYSEGIYMPLGIYSVDDSTLSELPVSDESMMADLSGVLHDSSVRTRNIKNGAVTSEKIDTEAFGYREEISLLLQKATSTDRPTYQIIEPGMIATGHLYSSDSSSRAYFKIVVGNVVSLAKQPIKLVLDCNATNIKNWTLKNFVTFGDAEMIVYDGGVLNTVLAEDNIYIVSIQFIATRSSTHAVVTCEVVSKNI